MHAAVLMNHLSSRAAVWTLMSLASALPRVASAAETPLGAKPQDQAAPPLVKLVAPKLLEDPGAEYPRQAVLDGIKDTVTVVVSLELDATGKVVRSSVVTPQGHGFDEAALKAAEGIRFEAATRDGVAIAAKVKHRYEFKVPASVLTVRVLSAENDKPVVGAVVRLTRVLSPTEAVAPEAPFTGPSNSDGAYPSEMPSGRYTLQVTAPEGFVDPEPSTIELSVGESQAVLVRLGLKVTPKVVGSDEAVLTVRARSKRPAREVTKRTLEQRELSRIPGTGGDALRAITYLPGVARPPGLAGLLIVRGSAPQDTTVYVDGTPIPIIYHFGGLSSVIPTEMVERLDFYPGNFSSQYGRAMGGIVDVGLREPKSDRLHLMGQIDLIDARAMAEGPVGKSGWRFAVAGRRSWVDAWLGPVLEATGSSVTAAPVYYDGQAVLEKNWSEKHDLRIAFFGSSDNLKLLLRSGSGSEPALTGGVGISTSFWRVQARYKYKFSDATEFKTTAAYGNDSIQFSLGDLSFRLNSHPVSLRSELTHKLSRRVAMNVGMDWLYTPYDISIRLPPIPTPGEPPSGPFSARQPLTLNEGAQLYRPALYTEFELTPWKGGRVVTGARLDYSKETKNWDPAPRFVARQDLSYGTGKRTTVKGGIGLFRQTPQPQDTNSVFGQSGITSNRAVHYTLGLEREFTPQIEASVEGFYRDLDNLVVPALGNQGSGYSMGIETLVRYKPDDHFFGFLAYTLSRSERRNTDTDMLRLFQYDQTHILTATGSYRLGKGWELGASARLVSGSMTTPRQYGFFDQSVGTYSPIAFPPFGERLPMFKKLDIRVDKAWVYKSWTLKAYLDLQNATNQNNPESVSYNYNSTQRQYGAGLPIIPSLGVRGEL